MSDIILTNTEILTIFKKSVGYYIFTLFTLNF